MIRFISPVLALATIAAADLSGTYSSAGVRLELKQTASQVDGTLRINDKSFPIHGTATGDAAACEINEGGKSYSFTARAKGEDVQIVSEDIRLVLKRESTSPLREIPAQQLSPELAAKFPESLAHPLGFTMNHPSEWKIRETGSGMALVPIDAPMIDGGPGEVYALAAMARPVAVGAGDDRAFIVQMTEEVAHALPAFRESRAPELSNDSSNRVVTLRYEAELKGRQYRGTLRATLRGELLIIMLSLGDASAIDARDTVATEVFSTVIASDRKLDRQILGSWTNSSSYSSSGFSMASSRTITLAADGTYTRTSRTAGGTSDVSADTGDSTSRGIWCAADGKLTLVDAAGNSTPFNYRVVDGNLVATGGNGKRTIWSR